MPISQRDSDLRLHSSSLLLPSTQATSSSQSTPRPCRSYRSFTIQRDPYHEEAVGVDLDVVLVPGDVRPRLPRGCAHEDDLASQDVLGLKVGPLDDLGTLSTGRTVINYE